MASTALKILSLYCVMCTTMALVTSLSSMRSSDVMTTDRAMTEKCKGNIAIKISDMRTQPNMNARIDMTDMTNGEVSLRSVDGPKEFCVKRESEVVVNFMQTIANTSNSTLGNPLSLLNKTKSVLGTSKAMYDKLKPKSFPLPAYRFRIEGMASAGNFPAMSISTTCHVCGKPCRICGHPIASSDVSVPGPCMSVHVPKCPLGARLLTRVPKRLDDMIPQEDFTFPPIKLQLADVTTGLADLPEILYDLSSGGDANPYVAEQEKLAQERARALKDLDSDFQDSKLKDVLLGETIKADLKLSLLNPEGELVSATGTVLMAT